MTTEGILAAQGADRWWAWAALRITPPGKPADAASPAPPDQPVHVHNEVTGNAWNAVQAGTIFGGVHFGGVHFGAHPPTTTAADSTWLRGVWPAMAAAGAAIELRYLSEPGESRLKCYLLIRPGGPNPDVAVGNAANLRAMLGDLPRHVTTAPVTSGAELRNALTPFPPHHVGLVEIRKRLTVTPATRGDTGQRWLTAITPFRGTEGSWQPLWDELARLPFRALLSVGLLPFPVGPGLRAHLDARVTELARLATPGPPPTGSWSVPRPADQFAVQALPLFENAARRYTEDQAFRVRVSLAAEQPVPDTLAGLLANTISAGSSADGVAGAPPVVIRPRFDEIAVAWGNIASLNFDSFGEPSPHVPPDAVGELERILASIVAVDEATAAFRLP